MTKDKQIEEMAKVIGGVQYLGGLEEKVAEKLIVKGYRKASDVALEAVDDFQSKLRHIFIAMCAGNDYNTVNLVQIDGAIEALFDSFVAELKKKYIGEDINAPTKESEDT